MTKSNEKRESNTPVVHTIALCTYNHVERLTHTLVDLGKVATPRQSWELLIVDNGSDDATPDLLRESWWRPPGWKVRVVREENLGIAHARNRAVREARGEYVIFLDDDETPASNWLIAMEEAIQTWHPDALGGKIEVSFVGAPRPAWLQDELLGFLGALDHGPEPRWLGDASTPIFTGNCAFRRDLFEDIGHFDTSLGRRGRENTGGEDTEMYRRIIALGRRVRWLPDALIYHRIQADKLKRKYFIDLHYRQGRMEATRKRGEKSRIPPAYLLPQLWRGIRAVIRQWGKGGRDTTLRKEMNVAYFIGYISGWTFG